MSRSLKLLLFFVPCLLQGSPLRYHLALFDNPPKGQGSYSSNRKKEERFPHSMEFQYFTMGDLMKGEGMTGFCPQNDEGRA